jgi:hypothetical protein
MAITHLSQILYHVPKIHPTKRMTITHLSQILYQTLMNFPEKKISKAYPTHHGLGLLCEG